MAQITPWLADIIIVLGAMLGLLIAIGIALALFTGWTARLVTKALPPRGRTIAIDDCRFHYVDEGEGPAIVMIHGLGGQMHNFTYALVGKLKDRFRVIVVDRPGSGYSSRPQHAAAGIESQAKTMAAFIRKLGLERPLLVGHSLGGAIALAIALNHPDCAGGLALISPLSHPQESVPKPFSGLVISFLWLRQLIAWTIATPFAITQRNVMLEAVFGPEKAPHDFAVKGGGLLSMRPASFCNAAADLFAAGDDLPGMIARYETLDMPVGVIYGTGDRVLDAMAHGKALTDKIAASDLVLIEDGGHMVLVTQPEPIADFITRIAHRIAKTEPRRSNHSN
jgi:pimeloyl-ACP methyl ester carboxylesterase